MRSATSPRKKDLATETNTGEPRASVLRRREGGPTGPRMTRSGESPREATTSKLLETRTTINIATWNVRTMLETSRAAQIATEMQKNNITVLGLCETRWPDSGELTLTSGEKILYSGQEGEDDRHTGGVGIMLAKRAQEALIEWKPISPRIILARFRSKTRNVTFINCYAPTNEAEVETKADFYDELQKTLNGRTRRDIIIVTGDFNAKIGKDNTGRERIMGREGLGTMNENGEMFADFCVFNDLVIGGSVFQHKDIHKGTWVSPDHRTVNQIDHITIDKKFRRSLQDTRVRRGADVASDHHLLVGQVRLKLKKCLPPGSKAGRKFNTIYLNDRALKSTFKLTLSNRFQALENCEDDPVEIMWETTKQAWKSTCEEVLGKKSRTQKEWLTAATMRAINKRREKKAELNMAKTRALKARLLGEHTALNKEVKKSARRDRRDHVERMTQDAEVAAGRGDMRELYQITKRLAGKKNTQPQHVLSKDGKTLTSPKEQLERWREHFQDLLNRPLPPNPADIPPAHRTLNVKVDPPSKAEIERAVKKLKANRAAGPDEIPPEALKADTNMTSKALHALFKKIWTAEEMPNDWKHGHLIKLPKKGNLKECSNWRGITLLSVPGKVFSRILLERIKTEVEKEHVLRDEQAGFRQERSTTDQIATLRNIIEQSLEWNTTLYTIFVDFEKAFDSVDRDTLWKLLAYYGIPEKIIKLIRMAFEPSTCQVVHNGSLTEPFTITTGVRQGCLLSPFLFLIVIDWIMRETTKDKKRGLQWSLMEQLEDIDYADDIALISQRHTDMKEKLLKLDEEARKTGLKINVKKTKSLRLNHASEATFSIRQDTIEEVQDFAYLGSAVSTEGGTDQDIRIRIGKAAGVFNTLRSIWRSTKLSLTTKLRIYNSNVKSVLLYGCETWRVLKSSMAKIQVFVNRCLRQILGVRWYDRLSNEELWRSTSQEPIEQQIKRRKWRWLGHTLRKPADNVTRRGLRWTPQGKRKRGRPKTTWRRSIEAEAKVAGLSWGQLERKAQDRGEWQTLVDDLCSARNDRN